MNKSEAELLFTYDRWANERILKCVEPLDVALLHHKGKTSHGSIFGTLVHLVGAEEVWLARWQGRAGVGLPESSEVGTFERLRERFDSVSAAIEGFVAKLEDEDLERELAIQTLAGKTFHHTFADMFRHLANHSSYHRGQAVTLLRQSDASVTSTDFIQFLRDR